MFNKKSIIFIIIYRHWMKLKLLNIKTRKKIVSLHEYYN